MDEPQDTRASFIEALRSDIETAAEAVVANNTPSNRRNAVRTIFAGIEGLFWAINEATYETLDARQRLQPGDRAIFQQVTHQVTDDGQVRERPSFVPLKTAIKFVGRQLKKVDDSFGFTLKSKGWQAVEKAKNVRDRLVHPKRLADLDVTDAELQNSFAAWGWMQEAYASALKVIAPAPHPDLKPPNVLSGDLLRTDFLDALSGQMNETLEFWRKHASSLDIVGLGGEGSKLLVQLKNTPIKAIRIPPTKIPKGKSDTDDKD